MNDGTARPPLPPLTRRSDHALRKAGPLQASHDSGKDLIDRGLARAEALADPVRTRDEFLAIKSP